MLQTFKNVKSQELEEQRVKKLISRFEDYIYVLAPKRYA